MTIQIRNARKTDAGPVSQINIQAWRESYPPYIDKKDIERLDLHNMTLNRHTRFAQGKANHVNLIAEDTGSIIGFCEGGPLRGFLENVKGEIYTLYVLKSHQNKGAGKRLLLEALKRLQESQHTPIIIRTLKENLITRGFYEYMGGKLIGEGTFHWLSRPYLEVQYLFS